VTKPRAADDFAAIRARMEEIRRERVLGTQDQQRPTDKKKDDWQARANKIVFPPAVVRHVPRN
jgi:hypothetical protein